MDIARLLDVPLDRGDNQVEDKMEVLLQRSDWRCIHTVKGDPSKKTSAKKKRRRLLARKNQRDAVNSSILNLTLDVNDLRQQVHACMVKKSLLETRQLVAREQFHARSLQRVDHFFQLFRHGYPAMLSPVEERFLSVILHENIAVGDGVRGQDRFLEQWRRYKKLFSVSRLKNSSARVVVSDTNGCLIECLGEFEGRVTTAALETVFPHVLEDEDLVAQVLHRRFVCPTRTRIYLNASGCVVQYDAFSDVFAAMNKLLGSNPDRVVQLMADAAISDNSLLPPVDESITNVEDAGTYSQQESGNTSPTNSTTSSKSSIEFILS